MRERVIQAHGTRCWLCRTDIDLKILYPDPMCFTLDHVIPKSFGGRRVLSNLRPAHRKCNKERGNKVLSGRRGLRVIGGASFRR